MLGTLGTGQRVGEYQGQELREVGLSEGSRRCRMNSVARRKCVPEDRQDSASVHQKPAGKPAWLRLEAWAGEGSSEEGGGLLAGGQVRRPC